MNPGELDLNLLTVLDALLQERHVSRAAARANLSEPTMSRSFRRLRRLFEDDLLVRVGREYYLTALGDQLAQPVHDILRQIAETVEQRPTFDPATDRRMFTVAAAEYGSFLVVRPLTARVVASAPGISIAAPPLLPETFRDLEEGRIDLAIAQSPQGSRLPYEELFVDNWVCAVWIGHPEVGATLSLDQYLELPHVVYGLDPAAEGVVDRALAKIGRTQRRAATIASHFMLPFYLEGTRLVSILPERIGRQLADLVSIRLLQPPIDLAPVRLAMIWHPRSTNDPGHRWLTDQIRDICAEM